MDARRVPLATRRRRRAERRQRTRRGRGDGAREAAASAAPPSGPRPLRHEFPLLNSRAEYEQYLRYPHFTRDGIKLVSLPPALRERLIKTWLENRKDRTLERADDVYVRSNGGRNPMYIVQIDPDVKRDVQQFVFDELTRWTGLDLKHTYTYGIREYTNGASLMTHVDRGATHILAAIVHVGQIDVRQPWALTTENKYDPPADHLLGDGHDVALYEAATLAHGRPEPLDGDVYANLFFHYAPHDWAEQVERCGMKGREAP